MGSPITVAVYPSSAAQHMSAQQITDSITYISPDVTIIPDQRAEAAFYQAAIDTPLIPIEDQRTVWISPGPGPQLAYIPSPDAFAELKHREETGEIDTETETFVFSPVLSIDIDLIHLETTLNGKDTYISHLQEAELTGSYTHLTPYAPPGYDSDWGDIRVCGTYPGADETGVKPSNEIAELGLHPDGTIDADTTSSSAFGLQALTQVGGKTADTLRNAGYHSVSDVATATIDELTGLDGFGKSRSQTVLYSARALTNGTIYRWSSLSVPNTDPVFIDIETDGLTPTMIWLIGVLDSRTGQYMSFMETDPDNPGRAVDGFMMWFAANARNRPVIAYNGERFDFPNLHDHINQYCPEYSDAWRNAWTFDPYWWAIQRNNAIFPGRTNTLEDVSESLGWETDDTGLTGAIVAKRFQQWMANPCSETELDWDAHKAYCEDDVRALQFVYDTLRNAPRIDGIQDQTHTVTSEHNTTAQGTLQDF